MTVPTYVIQAMRHSNMLRHEWNPINHIIHPRVLCLSGTAQQHAASHFNLINHIILHKVRYPSNTAQQHAASWVAPNQSHIHPQVLIFSSNVAPQYTASHFNLINHIDYSASTSLPQHTPITPKLVQFAVLAELCCIGTAILGPNPVYLSSVVITPRFWAVRVKHGALSWGEASS